MVRNQKGFSTVEILLVILILGLIGTVGWLVYDRQNSDTSESTSEQTTNVTQDTASENEQQTEELDVKTTDGIKYTVPAEWQNVEAPFEPYEVGSGKYLISPDFKEAGLGQLSIETGAFITFQDLEWEGIDSETSVAQAADVIRSSEGGYLDTDSVEVTSIAGTEVVMFNAGHTTDGVTVLFKNSANQWLDAGFSTFTGGDAVYNAQESSHYQIFTSWIEQFIELN